MSMGVMDAHNFVEKSDALVETTKNKLRGVLYKYNQIAGDRELSERAASSLQIFKKFVVDYKLAMEDNKRNRESLERKERAAKQRAEREARKEMKKGSGSLSDPVSGVDSGTETPAGEKNLFGLIDQMQSSATAEAIISRLEELRRQVHGDEDEEDDDEEW